MKAKLGFAYYITVGTQNLESERKLYEKLGFLVRASGDKPAPWHELYDESLRMILVESKEDYLGIAYVTDDMDQSIDALKSAGLKPVITSEEESAPKQAIVQMNDNMIISVSLSSKDSRFENGGKVLLDVIENVETELLPNAICGIFGELALSVNELDKSITCWKQLGFEITEELESPYPWAVLSDGLCVVGLHQTTDFSKPSITYFGRDIADKIEDLKAKGVLVKNMENEASAYIELGKSHQIFLFELE